MDLSRRAFIEDLTRSLLFLGLRDWGMSRKLWARPPAEIAKWVARSYDLSRAVKSGEISPLGWQRSMQELLAHVDLAEFLAFIDFDTLAAQVTLPPRGELFKDLQAPEVPGVLPAHGFYMSLVGFHRGRSIPPHGHRDLVSSFLVLKGQLHGRHYDRVEDEGKTFLLRPTIDRTFRVGEFSTVSDYKDNVHWFTAETEACFMIDFGIRPLTPGQHPSGRFYLDVGNGEPASGDLMRVHSIAPDLAYRTYG